MGLKPSESRFGVEGFSWLAAVKCNHGLPDTRSLLLAKGSEASSESNVNSGRLGLRKRNPRIASIPVSEKGVARTPL